MLKYVKLQAFFTTLGRGYRSHLSCKFHQSLSHVVKVNKNNRFPWVSIRSGSRSHPQRHSLRCNVPNHRGLLLTTISTEDHLGLPGVSASAKISNWLFLSPEILHEPWNTLLDWSGILTRKRRLMILKLTGESTNIGKKTWEERYNTWGFQGDFPWKTTRQSVSPLKRGYRVFPKRIQKGKV